MTTIVLPVDLEESLAKQATERGVTVESLAIETLRHSIGEIRPAPKVAKNLRERLGSFIGAIDGPHEAISEDCGLRFGKGLVAKNKVADG